MHPVLFTISVEKIAPYLSNAVLALIVVAVAVGFYKRARALGMDSSAAISDAALPTIVAAVVGVLARNSQKAWPLHSYGVLIALAFVAGIGMAVHEARRQGFDEEQVLDMGFWALVSGMVGARVYFIAVNWKQYFVTQPFTYVEQLKMEIPSVLAVWQGGLVFYGGALGATATFFWFARKRKLEVGRFADILIPSLPLGHALGRMGCFAAGCCWGDAAYHLDAAGQVVSDFPFAAQFPRESLAYGSLLTTVPPEIREWMVQTGHTTPLYPTQWMESFGNILLMGVLLLVRTRKVFHGQVAATYFILYPLLRATMEFFRGDAERGYIIDKVLSVGQFTSILVASAALVAVVLLARRNRSQLAAAPA